MLEGRRSYPIAGLHNAIVAPSCRMDSPQQKQVAKGSRFHLTLHSTLQYPMTFASSSRSIRFCRTGSRFATLFSFDDDHDGVTTRPDPANGASLRRPGVHIAGSAEGDPLNHRRCDLYKANHNIGQHGS
jgi:hypothetical protein